MMICKHVDDHDKPLDLTVYLSDVKEVKFEKMLIELKGTFRFVFRDID